jgi:hypothetical protein
MVGTFGSTCDRAGGGARPAQRPPAANAMVKAIARAFRWREMLENGAHATIAEIAAAEKINPRPRLGLVIGHAG